MTKMLNDEHLATLKAKARRIREQIAEAEAVQRKAQRKKDTRLKVLLGAAILADAAFHDSTKAALKQIASRAITLPRDRQFLAEAGWIEPIQPRGQSHLRDNSAPHSGVTGSAAYVPNADGSVVSTSNAIE